MIIYQPQEGYCYNSDTIFLYDFIRSIPIKGEVLDVGSGSGILAVLIKRDFLANVSAVEIQEEFVRYAKINAAANKLDLTIYLGDFLRMHFDKRFDYIVSNPPFYHPNVVRSSNRMIDQARYSGHLPMEKFFHKVSMLLKPKGSFIFCYDAKQIEEIASNLAASKLRMKKIRFIHPKRDRAASLVLIHAQKGSKSLCEVLPPHIVFEGERYSKETNEIFKRVGVHSIKCKI